MFKYISFVILLLVVLIPFYIIWQLIQFYKNRNKKIVKWSSAKRPRIQISGFGIFLLSGIFIIFALTFQYQIISEKIGILVSVIYGLVVIVYIIIKLIRTKKEKQEDIEHYIIDEEGIKISGPERNEIITWDNIEGQKTKLDKDFNSMETIANKAGFTVVKGEIILYVKEGHEKKQVPIKLSRDLYQEIINALKYYLKNKNK